MEAIPHLIEAMKGDDDALREQVADVLSRIGSPAVPHVFDVVKSHYILHESLNVRDQRQAFFKARSVLYGAIGCLRNIGSPAVTHLIEALKGEDTLRRKVAAHALARMSPHAAMAGADLIKALDDDDRTVRREATKAVPSVIKDSEKAILLLSEKLSDTDELVRAAAVITLSEFEQGPPLFAAQHPNLITPVLLEAMKDDSQVVRASAIDRLRFCVGEAVPHLMDALTHQNAKTRREAIAALGSMRVGPGMGQLRFFSRTMPSGGIIREVMLLTPQIISVLADKDADVRDTAIEVLGRIAVASETQQPVTPLLAEALKSEHPTIRRATAAALGRMPDECESLRWQRPCAEAAVRVLPHLIAALDDDDRDVRASSGDAIAQWASFLTRIPVGSLIPVLESAHTALKNAKKEEQSDTVQEYINLLRSSPSKPAVPAKLTPLSPIEREQATIDETSSIEEPATARDD